MKKLFKVQENDPVAAEIGSLFEFAPCIYGSFTPLPEDVFVDGDVFLKADENSDHIDWTPVAVIAIEEEDGGGFHFPHVYHVHCAE